MDSVRLLQALVDQLRVLFRGYSLANKAGILQEVQVFRQYLPQPAGITFSDKDHTGLPNYGSADYESNFPCIIVKCEEQLDTEERGDDGTRVNVKVLTGIYDDNRECQGYIDILNMQEKIRAYLLEHRVIADRFLLMMPMKSKLLETETWPVYFGEQVMTYITARPMMGSEWIYGHKRT